MRIVKLHINEFGPLVDKTFDFDDALTIIKGDNESGKSTILLFIKFVLYGLARRARSSAVGETDRAVSHASGGASGYMIVSHGGNLYRIDRQMRSSSVQMIELETGLKCDFGSSPGEFLLGIPAEVFENTCGIFQLGCSTVKGEQISNAIRNLLSSADESIDSQKAIKSLDSVRIKYLHKDKKGGSIYNLTMKEEELAARYAKSVEDSCETERIEADIARLNDSIAEVSAKQKKAEELSSKITLRAVIKLFDKLHEYERDKEETVTRLLELNTKLQGADSELDRAFVAELMGITNELELADGEYARAKAELETLSAKESDADSEILEKIERAGGLEKVSTLVKKCRSAIKTHTAFAGVFTSLTLFFAALFAFYPLTVFLPLGIGSLALSLSFIFIRSRAMRRLKKICAELGTAKDKIQELLHSAESVILRDGDHKALLEQKKAELSIKERVLSSALTKCSDILTSHKISVGDTSAKEMIKLAREIADKTNTLLSERDICDANIKALDSRISDLSAELSDYNEHQTRRRVSEEIFAMSDEEIRDAKKDKSILDLQLKTLTDKKLNFERALLERKYSTQNPFDIAAKLSETSEQLSSQKERYKAIALAIESLQTASANLRNTIAPKIRASANEYMRLITDGKYDSVAVSDTLELSMSEEGFSYPIDAFSTGTKDAAYLALRLSLLLLISSDETPPLLLDETLAMIDDKRATKLLSMLSAHASEHGQCIIFCCHDREERLCQAAGINFRSIEI